MKALVVTAKSRHPQLPSVPSAAEAGYPDLVVTSWQAVAAYSYSWQYTGYQVAALIGFRALGVNYASGSGVDTVANNEVLYGPIIGVSFRF